MVLTAPQPGFVAFAPNGAVQPHRSANSPSARTALFANFDGEFSGVNQFYAGKGGLKYLF